MEHTERKDSHRKIATPFRQPRLTQEYTYRSRHVRLHTFIPILSLSLSLSLSLYVCVCVCVCHTDGAPDYRNTNYCANNCHLSETS